MEEGTWSSKCRTFKASGSFPRRRPRNTCNKVFRSDLREEKSARNLLEGINAWKSFIRNFLIHASIASIC